MRVLYKFGLCLLVAGAVSAAHADIIVDGYTLPREDVSSYNVQINSDGSYNIQITTTAGYMLAPEGTPPPPPDPNAITVSLSADLTTINQFEQVTFTWTSTNADTCTTSGGNVGWANLGDVGPSGSRALRMNLLTPDPFILTCNSATQEPASSSLVITVVDPNAPPAPPPPLPGPNANCPASEASGGDIDTWSDFWGGQAFPNQDIVQKDDRIGRNEYLALEFNTGTFNGFGVVKTIQFSDGNRNVAISECPGVFLQDVPAACFQRQANGQSLFWSTDGSQGCNLENDKTYYLNITYVDVNNESTSSSFCASTSCRFYLSGGAAAQ